MLHVSILAIIEACLHIHPTSFRKSVDFMLKEAKSKGASDAVAEVSEGQGLSVTVRKGEVETIEQSLDKQVGVTVFWASPRECQYGSDFSKTSLKATVDAAYHIAQHTAEDDCAGPAESTLLEKKPLDLDLFHPWDIDAAHAVEIARAAEGAAFAVSKQIQNSDGASVSAHHAHFMMATSQGFMGGYPFSRHYISLCANCESWWKKSQMQRDDW
jgi:PmbA protein